MKNEKYQWKNCRKWQNWHPWHTYVWPLTIL